MTIEPLALFSIQFTFALIAYALAARWYVVPRLRPLSPAAALVPLVWVHVFRILGGMVQMAAGITKLVAVTAIKAAAAVEGAVEATEREEEEPDPKPVSRSSGTRAGR